MNGVAGTDTFPAMAEVDRVVGLGDAVLRNLHITQCYHELSLAVAQRAGPYANWCTFATWASKQAGQSIRKEDLARALDGVLTTAPTTIASAADVASAARLFGARRETEVICRLVLEALNPGEAIERVSDAVARGNRKVFAEIGREFARFAATCLGDPALDEEAIARFCDGLRPGDPPDGQRYLRQAFARYYQAFFEPDATTRTQLILLANLEIGLHEQTRLQPEIAEALDAAMPHPRRCTLRVLSVLFPYRSWLVYLVVLVRRLLGRPTLLEAAIDRLIADARRQIRLLLTEHMMVLCFPRGVRLRLGDDLKAAYPATLRQVSSPDLRALLAQIDPTPDSLRETGAADWADLPDRLHFIADLFRCYQEAPDLREPPFTPGQVAALRAGRLPDGPL